MKKELDNFIIESDSNIGYFDDIVQFIISYEKSIFDFFNLDGLSKKFRIIIMNYDLFKQEQIKRYGKITSYVRGITDVKNNLIMILDIDDQKKYTTHKDAKLEDTLKMIIHEVVHACNSEINNDFNQTIWFREGLATNLAHQDYSLINLDECNFELLKNDFNNYGKNNYTYAYTIVYYILNNYNKEEIDIIISNSEYLRENAYRLFEEAKHYFSGERSSF